MKKSRIVSKNMTKYLVKGDYEIKIVPPYMEGETKYVVFSDDNYSQFSFDKDRNLITFKIKIEENLKIVGEFLLYQDRKGNYHQLYLSDMNGSNELIPDSYIKLGRGAFNNPLKYLRL